MKGGRFSLDFGAGHRYLRRNFVGLIPDASPVWAAGTEETSPPKGAFGDSDEIQDRAVVRENSRGRLLRTG